MLIKCSEYLLTELRKESPQQLAQNKTGGPEIVGNVLIHPFAKIDPSARV